MSQIGTLEILRLAALCLSGHWSRQVSNLKDRSRSQSIIQEIILQTKGWSRTKCGTNNDWESVHLVFLQCLHPVHLVPSYDNDRLSTEASLSSLIGGTGRKSLAAFEPRISMSRAASNWFLARPSFRRRIIMICWEVQKRIAWLTVQMAEVNGDDF